MDQPQQFPEKHRIRNVQEINRLVNTAIQETVNLFGSTMSEFDKQLLESAIAKEMIGSMNKIGYLVKFTENYSWDEPEKMKGYLNQILQTLRQQLSDEERAQFTGWAKERNLLDEIL